MQELSEKICKEYQHKKQRNWKLQRELSNELQSRCNIPQIWALNIVNGYYIQDYLAIQEYQKREIDIETEKQKQKYFEELLYALYCSILNGNTMVDNTFSETKDDFVDKNDNDDNDEWL